MSLNSVARAPLSHAEDAFIGIRYRHEDIAMASLIENWVEETQGRVWFLRKVTVCDMRSN
jgi:hypothetical protein